MGFGAASEVKGGVPVCDMSEMTFYQCFSSAMLSSYPLRHQDLCRHQVELGGPVRYHQNHSSVLSAPTSSVPSFLRLPLHFSILKVGLLVMEISLGLIQVGAGMPGPNSEKLTKCL